MKKAVSVFEYILFALIALPSLITLIFTSFGYTVTFFDYTAVALLTAVVAVAETVLSVIAKRQDYNKTVSVLFALSAPLLLIRLFMSGNLSATAAVCILISICCCFYLTVKHGRPTALKVIGLVIFLILILPVCFLTLAELLFGSFGQNTVVETLPSPGGTYYAEVIDSDQGALGGDTIVNVYENFEFNAVIFKITKTPKGIYSGEWGEYKSMKIHWKDEKTLVINSVEYAIE